MLTPKRILVLIAVSVLLTVALYYIDSDPPTDNFFARAMNTFIDFCLVLLLYCGGYGLYSLVRRK